MADNIVIIIIMHAVRLFVFYAGRTMSHTVHTIRSRRSRVSSTVPGRAFSYQRRMISSERPSRNSCFFNLLDCSTTVLYNIIDLRRKSDNLNLLVIENINYD